MSPEQLRAKEPAAFARSALESLGVNSKAEPPTEALILDHSMGQASLELEAVEQILEAKLQHDPELGGLVYVVQAIRRRLDFARDTRDLLVTLIAEGGTT